MASRWSAALLLVPLVGCALVYEGKYDWDDGWRAGRVVHLGQGKQLPAPPGGDCRQGVAASVMEKTLYADVRYQTEGRWTRERIVPIPADIAVHEGDLVYFNAQDCKQAVVAATASH